MHGSERGIRVWNLPGRGSRCVLLIREHKICRNIVVILVHIVSIAEDLEFVGCCRSCEAVDRRPCNLRGNWRHEVKSGDLSKSITSTHRQTVI
jgi:hypothetical protein